MKGRTRALLRLWAVQGAWSYERMIGVGMGYASQSLLGDLESADPVRHREAVARSAEFFNCHPYLAGLALGASARAEHDGVPGAQIQRLRTALCSPLGALGDQLFWAGLVPILMSLALVVLALGGGGLVLVGVVLLYNVARVLVTRWALMTGLEHRDAGRHRDLRLLAPSHGGAHRGAGGVRRPALPSRWSAPGCSRRPPAVHCWSRWVCLRDARRAAMGRRPLDRAARGAGPCRDHSPLDEVRIVIERQATIVNPLGMHARPAARLVKLASGFQSHIELVKDDLAINGKSIMGVMMLAAECGSSITIRAEGPDAEAALDALARPGGGRVRRIVSDPRRLQGVGVSPGVGFAPAMVVHWGFPDVADRTVGESELEGEVPPPARRGPAGGRRTGGACASGCWCGPGSRSRASSRRRS